MPRRSFTAAGALLGLLLTAAPAQAEAPAGEAALLGWYNRKIHAFNEWAVARFGSPASWTVDGLISPAAGQAFANALANLVNEPATALAGLVAGDDVRAANAASRFALNSTLGLAGIHDVAAERGQPADHLDLGLALCARGVPEGPVVVVPFVGPRTLRDGLADGLYTSVLFFYVPYFVLGEVPALTAWSVLGASQIVGRTIAFRQLDPETIALPGDTYEEQRLAYLAQRQARCERYRSTMGRGAP
jgi:phospholipid-binding lipoprotein MlaA